MAADTTNTSSASEADGAPARLTQAEVAHVAVLARLALDEHELATMTAELAGILAHANDVASLDLAGVEPTAHPLPLENVFRPDRVRDRATTIRDEALAGAPATEDGRFKVPRILADEA